MDAPIRVLVVDDSPGLAQRLPVTLARRPGVHVLGPVEDEDEAGHVVSLGHADVIVVDLARDDGRGRAIVSSLRDGYDAPVLVASSPRAEDVAAALAAGACGVLEDAEAPVVLDALRRAMSGELVLPAGELPSLVARIRPSVAGGLARLTHREREILRLFAEGLSTAEVATRLGISVGTVQSHAKNLLAKLGVHTKVEAVRLALRDGIAAAERTA